MGGACPLVLTWPHPLSPPPLQLHASSPPQQQEPKTRAFQCLFCSHVHVKTTRSDRGNMCIHSPTKVITHPVWGKVAMGTCVWSPLGPGEFLTGAPDYPQQHPWQRKSAWPSVGIIKCLFRKRRDSEVPAQCVIAGALVCQSRLGEVQGCWVSGLPRIRFVGEEAPERGTPLGGARGGDCGWCTGHAEALRAEAVKSLPRFFSVADAIC